MLAPIVAVIVVVVYLCLAGVIHLFGLRRLCSRVDMPEVLVLPKVGIFLDRVS